MPCCTYPSSPGYPFMLLPRLLQCGAVCTVQGCHVAQPCHSSSEVGQAPSRTCETSALCCALFQQDVQELPKALFMSSTWKTMCLNHSLNHRPLLGRLFFVLRKRLLYQLHGYLFPHHLTLFDLPSLVKSPAPLSGNAFGIIVRGYSLPKMPINRHISSCLSHWSLSYCPAMSYSDT